MAQGCRWTRIIPEIYGIGYVSTAYATRQYSAVLEDVLIYAKWRLDGNELGIRGIFFDETPNQWSSANASYLRSINSLVKSSSGFGVERLVIHNPGTIPHWRLMRGPCLPDIAVVFEASHQTYFEAGCEEALTKLDVVPERLACIMHSVPHSLMTASSDVGSQIKQLAPLVGTVFITSQSSDLYTSLGAHWDQFIQAVNA
ncbi:cell surface spherulin 4 protein [Rutstroemia sp. NJR-2017a WRK4]|nr:cell surface spherulin 4 protein [Rutstroemia sp. NJR-2017a WRK4]